MNGQDIMILALLVSTLTVTMCDFTEYHGGDTPLVDSAAAQSTDAHAARRAGTVTNTDVLQ